FARFAFHADVALKGFSENRRIYADRGHRLVSDFFHWGAADENWQTLLYYRSDDDLASAIQWFESTWENAPTDELIRAIALLRQVPMTRTNGAPLTQLLSWLAVMINGRQLNADQGRILASAVRLAENFAGELDVKSQAGKKLIALMGQATEHVERRVVANAI